jgi:transcriptional regulator with XRE-family HTH domain
MQLSLKDARHRKGWTLQRLAAESGVNKSTVLRLERGDNVPSYDTVLKLESALGLRRGSLVFDIQRSEVSA